MGNTSKWQIFTMVVNHHFRVYTTNPSIYLFIYLSISLSLSTYTYIYICICICICICGYTIQDIGDCHTVLRDLSTTQLTLQLEVQLASERNIDQVLSEFREYASEVVGEGRAWMFKLVSALGKMKSYNHVSKEPNHMAHHEAMRMDCTS